jgi:MHS family proline/betaine transporter-like MFS transporter
MQRATAIFGGLTPFLSHYLIEQSGWPLVPGAMIAAVALCILPIFITLRETRPRSP